MSKTSPITETLAWLDSEIAQAASQQQQSYAKIGEYGQRQGERWHARQIALYETKLKLEESSRSSVLAQTPGVKPLEWEAGKGQLDGQLVWSAGEPWLFWIVKNPSDSHYVWCENFNIEGFFPCSPVRGSYDTLDEAKAAAQVDYTKRVLGALVASPDTSTDRASATVNFNGKLVTWAEIEAAVQERNAKLSISSPVRSIPQGESK